MVLTAKAKKLVYDSWHAIPDQNAAGLVWFTRMFEQYPDMTNLYKFLRNYNGDPAKHPFLPQHAGRVMRKMDISVNQLMGDIKIMLQDLKTLGSRHPGYGVNPFKHVAPTLDSLIFMLKRQLGSKFDAETEDAWRKFFGVLVEGMGLTRF